ncbi:class I SAM-dependent methyltransferase [Haloechinothrix sp. YIM 98757]|uniref:Class I SAM-dependent methyltransferase n=1 Tax=Haloechinothrix aidingensis TaxID=2752311 RepID=A0A838AB93_9PSEU|nr:class I SAM-dependent methyltransferase [Haloechinothrix aidingensis]MBA0126478.1 class I SAM-dependent methyltransferase [Haloechinothrix aidingensis]
MSSPTEQPTGDAAVAQLKQTHRVTWAAGEYAKVAELVDDVPPRHLLDLVGVAPGQEVLDVATGTGNVALRAARAGADVTGLDLAPELLDAAHRRAAEWGVTVEWVTGDAEELPLGDNRFDRVLSVLGVQFAPRHEVVARELARVCKPGGIIGLINWTPDSQVGRMLRIIGSYMPAPPPFASPPPKWGDEDHVRGLFAGTGIELEFHYGTNPFRFPSADDYMAFFEDYYGPMVKVRERLSAEDRWGDCRDEIIGLLEELNTATDGTLRFEAEYTAVVGRKP